MSSTEADFKCLECEETFSRREHLQRHSRTHTKERPFKCSGCDESFARIDSLGRHYSTIHARNSSTDGSEAVASKIKRVTKACSNCSRSKLRCDGQVPCQRCQGSNYICSYEPSRKRKRMTQGPKSHDPGNQYISPASHHSVQEHGSPSTDFNPPLSNGFFNSNTALGVPPHQIPPSNGLSNAIPAPSSAYHSQHSYDFAGFPENIGFDPGDEIAGLFSMSIDAIPNGVSPFFWSNPLMMLDFDAQFGQSFAEPNPTAIEDTHTPQSNTSGQQPAHDVMSPPKSIVETYSQAGTPFLDKDNMNVRQYIPNKEDACLSFPDMTHISDMEVDQENHAHFNDFDSSYFDPLLELEEHMAKSSVFPHWENLQIPPIQVLNAWMQLYFEHFHPMFPIIHQPTFGGSETYYLLAFAMATIGAKYSKMKDAHKCSLAMQELVRRQCAYLCETQHQNTQQLWMAQIIILNHITLMYCGNRRTLEIAEVLQSIPVALSRRRGMLEDVFSHEKTATMKLSPDQLWRLWVHDEERRRLAYGIWIVDSTFALHFDLSELMTVHEMRNSLPCAEILWNAKTAQSWSSSFSGLLPKKLPILSEAVATSNYQVVFASTGYLGRQSIIHCFAKVIRSRDFITLGPSDDELWKARRLQASTKIERFMEIVTLESESNSEPRANTVLQLSLLTIKLAMFSPVVEIPPIAFRYIYGVLNNDQVRSALLDITASPSHARQAMLYAGDIYNTIRSKRPQYFSDPIMLLRGTIMLYMYSKYDMEATSTGVLKVWNPEHRSFFLQVDVGEEIIRDWVLQGIGRPKLPGIGTICTKEGRLRLLKVAGELMSELKVWRVSRSYGKILERLMDKEMS